MLRLAVLSADEAHAAIFEIDDPWLSPHERRDEDEEQERLRDAHDRITSPAGCRREESRRRRPDRSPPPRDAPSCRNGHAGRRHATAKRRALAPDRPQHPAALSHVEREVVRCRPGRAQHQNRRRCDGEWQPRTRHLKPMNLPCCYCPAVGSSLVRFIVVLGKGTRRSSTMAAPAHGLMAGSSAGRVRPADSSTRGRELEAAEPPHPTRLAWLPATHRSSTLLCASTRRGDVQGAEVVWSRPASRTRMPRVPPACRERRRPVPRRFACARGLCEAHVRSPARL